MKVLYATALILLPAVWFSQQNVVKAYVVNLKGDTIRGEAQLNPKKPMMIYDKVVFKDKNGVQKNYKPDKLKSYGLDNDHFLSFTYDGEPKFYKVVVRGAINLYEVSFEYVEGKSVQHESEYFLALPDNRKLIPVRTTKFKKQLADWMKDNPEIAEKYPDKLEFDATAATEHIVEYNTWKATQ